MKAILPGVFGFSRFSAEKQLDFNGHLLLTAAGGVLIDPPLYDEALHTEVGEHPIRLVLITNSDHRRAGPEWSQALDVPLWVPTGDATAFDVPFDATYAPGDHIADELEAIGVPHAKTPGETAIFWPARRLLVLGDALIGKPAGALSFLPPEKFADYAKARLGARRLLELEVDVILVGDGVSLLSGAEDALAAALA